MPDLSSRLDHFKPSKIAEIFALASRLKEQGEDIADLSTGEPDFATDSTVCDAAKAAMDRGETKYTPVDGTSTLKRAIQEKFKRDNQLDYALDEIIADSGAKPLLAHTLMATISPGNEVIIPTPCWPSHPGVIQLCGATPVFVKGTADSGFKLQPDDLEAAITDQTRAIILNSPSNPTGAVYNGEELKAITDVLKRHPHIWILADDIYEKLIYDGREFVTVAQIEPELKSRTITINGLSKAYAMTGWRIGYAGGPKALMAAVRRVMTQSTGSPCAVSQAAAAAALNGDQGYVAEQVAIYQRRRDRMVSQLNQADGLSVSPCEGAFYLYVNCEGVLGKTTAAGKRLESSTDFAQYLLEECKVAIVPGGTFEYDPYFRLSFATSDEQLEKAAQRMIQGCAELKA